MSLISATTRAALEEILETALRPAPSNWQSIRFGTEVIGHIQPDYLGTIEAYIANSETPALVRFGDYLQLEKLSPYLLSQELQELAEFLKKEGLAPGWRN